MRIALLLLIGCSGPGNDDEDIDGDGDGALAPEDCDDSDPTVSPDLDEICRDGRDNDCDGTDNGCTLHGDLDLEAAWGAKPYGEDPGDRAGFSVVSAGDVDGDGTPDLLIGAPNDPGGATYGGAAYVLSAPFDGPLDLREHGGKLLGEGKNDNAGYAVAPAGDIDGDGFADVAVGAPGYGDFEDGAVYVIRSPPTEGRLHLSYAESLWVGAAPFNRAGAAIAGGRDVDGDDVPDLVVGAPGFVSAGDDVPRGLAYLVTSTARNTHDLHTEAAAVWAGDVEGSELGTDVALADVDGDGRADVVVAAEAAGTVYGFTDPAGGSAADADVVLTEERRDDGAQVDSGGDVNGDGYEDLLAGAPNSDLGGATQGGAVHVLLGPIASGRVYEGAATFRGTSAQAGVGTSVTAVDLDGDGIDDVVTGAPRDDGGGPLGGAVYAFYGPITGGALEPDIAWFDTQEGAFAGAAIAGLGDTDGDGYEDVAIGAYGDSTSWYGAGAVFVVFGSGL